MTPGRMSGSVTRKKVWTDNLSAKEALVKLTAMRQLGVYQHHGFWQCMDTPREMDLLNDLWQNDKAAWAVWR